MRLISILFVITLIFSSCTTVHYKNLHTSADNPKINRLSNMLYQLSNNKDESKELATLAITQSKVLANKYQVVSSPWMQNLLVNTGFKQRGLCYQYVEDIMPEIRARGFKSFDFKWGQANANKLNEHNVIVVLKKGNNNFNNGIILDAWRHSGDLYFTKVKNDPKYHFVDSKEGDRRLGLE